MVLSRALRLLLVAAAAAACGESAPPAGPGPVQPTADTPPAGYLGFRVGGQLRIYRLHLPASGLSGQVPLVLVLHGYSSNARDMQNGTGFDTLADTVGLVVAYPEATGSPTAWNAGGPYERLTGQADDIGFIAALIDTLAAHYPIDRGRVYAVGHSNGGFMVYRLAHDLARKIAAVAPVAGSEFQAPYTTPEADIGIVHLHALDDGSVLFDGMMLGGVWMFSVPVTLERWWSRQCGNVQPDTLVNAGGVVGVRWRSPTGRGDVALYTTTTGGHRWPRASVAGLEARDVIWKFFESIPPRPR